MITHHFKGAPPHKAQAGEHGAEHDAQRDPQRDPWTAVMRGALGRCPNCGKGKLFRKFLKVTDNCPACGEAYHHHRADDAPAYFVILIVGHIVVPLALAVETAYDLPYWAHMWLWTPLTIGLSLALLQPAKGAIVALQWAFRMHGFDPETNDDVAVAHAGSEAERRP